MMTRRVQTTEPAEAPAAEFHGEALHLDRAFFHRLLRIDASRYDPHSCLWSTESIVRCLRASGHPEVDHYLIRRKLRVSGFKLVDDRSAWQEGPALRIPPSPRAFDYILDTRVSPKIIDPTLLIPAPGRLPFLRAAVRANRWLLQTEAVAIAAPGMPSGGGITNLDANVRQGMLISRPTQRADARSDSREWSATALGCKTLELVEPVWSDLLLHSPPGDETLGMLYLMQSFPHGLFMWQILQAQQRASATKNAYRLVQLGLKYEYIKRHNMRDEIGFVIDGHEGPFYRLTERGQKLCELMRALTRLHEAARGVDEDEDPSAPLLDEADIPIADPILKRIASNRIDAAILPTPRQPKAVHLVAGADGRLVYRGPPLSDKAAVGIGFGLALQRLRVSKGLSQKEVTQRARVMPDYIPNLELGRRTPPPSKWKTFGRLYSITQTELLILVARIIEDELPLKTKTTRTKKGALLRLR